MLAGGRDQVVACAMSQAIIHYFEVIDVYKEDGHLPVTTRRSLEGLRERFHEEDAVWQVGQRVVERLVLQSSLKGLVLGNVAGYEHCGVGQAMNIAHYRAGKAESPGRAVFEGVVNFVVGYGPTADEAGDLRPEEAITERRRCRLARKFLP